MNTEILIDLFNIGYNHSSAPEYISTVSSVETNLVVLGRKFSIYDKRPPEFIYLDGDHVLTISEDMIRCFGVFAKGRDLLLIDQNGQVIDIWNYPNNDTVFSIATTKFPHLVSHANARH